ncbi:MAG TPA: VOC family protein [Trebonia sp.]|nr:VOC family protein [Trebonia sp.]
MRTRVDVPVVVSGFDHLALTVASADEAVAFYTDALGMRASKLGEGEWAVSFGEKKIWLLEEEHGQVPRASRRVPGSAELCLITPAPLESVVGHLVASGVKIEAGPTRRLGANGPVTSVCVRDPDGNLVQIASYDSL